jgi:hypothetical protein
MFFVVYFLVSPPWPMPEGVTGLFVFAFPTWMLVVLAATSALTRSRH